jgi:type IV secretory pathway VirB10-like protein
MQPAYTIASLRERTNTRRRALGWGITLLGHLIVFVWLLHTSQPRLANPEIKQVKRIDVWLMTSALTTPMRTTTSANAVAPSVLEATRTASRSSPKVPRPYSSAAPAVPVASQPSATVATPPALATQSIDEKTSETGTPAFDLAAARASARAIARADPTPVVTRTLREGEKNANTSDRIQERFEHARRVNCLKPNESMNLLANVALLAKDLVANAVDDSGCKW